MKNRFLFFIILIALSFQLNAQAVSINLDGSNPDPSSILDVKSTNKGMLLPRLNTTERDGIMNPATGLIIYNTTINCLEVNSGTPAMPLWSCLGQQVPAQPVVANISCGGAIFTPNNFTGHITYAGILSIPYSGGNGVDYPGGSATWSTGVTGLTAVLLSGTLNNGAGTLNYLVAGTPSSGGVSTFPIVFAGQSCLASFSGSNSIPGNSTCDNEFISGTGCGVVSGVTLNDDPLTSDGVEYDWTDATGYMYTTTRALVEIGGQCWFRYNAIANTDSINNWPTGINTTFGTPIQWGTGIVDDFGFHGFYNIVTTDGTESWQAGEPAPGEGQLYQWSAAMKGSNANRAQGVCPAGWHIPSDCEWMYLESVLGMGIVQQQQVAWRPEGNVGTKLLVGGSSGFNGLLGGLRAGQFSQRGSFTQWWSSTPLNYTSGNAWMRSFTINEPGSYRNSSGPWVGVPVRCLKD